MDAEVFLIAGFTRLNSMNVYGDVFPAVCFK
jgi:hypothetical protein